MCSVSDASRFVSLNKIPQTVIKRLLKVSKFQSVALRSAVSVCVVGRPVFVFSLSGARSSSHADDGDDDDDDGDGGECVAEFGEDGVAASDSGGDGEVCG